MTFLTNLNTEKKGDNQDEPLVDHDQLAREPAPPPSPPNASDSGSHPYSVVFFLFSSKPRQVSTLKAILLIISAVLCIAGGIAVRILIREHKHKIFVEKQLETDLKDPKFNQDLDNFLQQRNDDANRAFEQLLQIQDESTALQKQAGDINKLIKNMPDIPDYLKKDIQLDKMKPHGKEAQNNEFQSILSTNTMKTAPTNTQNLVNRYKGLTGSPNFVKPDVGIDVTTDKQMEVMNSEMQNTFDSLPGNVNIDTKKDQNEQIWVPDFPNKRRVKFIHDFNRNVTGIIDVRGKMCFVMPLNRENVIPSRIHVVIPVDDPESISEYIARKCKGRPMYRVKKDYVNVAKRSVEIY